MLKALKNFTRFHGKHNREFKTKKLVHRKKPVSFGKILIKKEILSNGNQR